MSIQPLRDYVLVRPLDASQVEGSTLYVPEDPTAKIQRGEVVAVGDNLSHRRADVFVPVRDTGAKSSVVPCLDGSRVYYVDVGYIPPEEAEVYIDKVKERLSEDRPLSLQVGNVVLYSVYGANEIRDGGQKLFLVPAKELMGVVVRDPA